MFARAAPAAAQRIDLWLDAAAAHARPPGGVQDAEPATYGILGARLGLEGRAGALELMLHGGLSADVDGGAWTGGSLRGQTGGLVAPFHLSGRMELFGLHYRDPFGYRAYGAMLRPQAAWLLGRWSLVARGELTRGRWRADAQEPPLPPGVPAPPQPAGEPATGPLGVTGGALEAVCGCGPAGLRLGIETYDSDAGGLLDGSYRGLVGSASYATRRIAAAVELRGWWTPAGEELGYDVALAIGVRPDVQLRLQAGRTVRDPLYGVPGSTGVSVGASWRIGAFTPSSSRRVVEVGERVGAGRRVTFRVRAPAARSVALSGDFTGWEPRAMRREDGGTWVLDLVLEPGLHYFGFLVDGARWVVPDEAPGVADDGWGRKNASVVVEG